MVYYSKTSGIDCQLFIWNVGNVFYCTNNMNQSIRWANRGIGEPIINYYEYVPTENLKILRFPEISDEWLDFIAECRSGKTHTYEFPYPFGN